MVQEVFATVCKKIKTFTKDGKPASFRRWLCTIFDIKMHEYWRLQPDVPVDPTDLNQAPAPQDPSDTDGQAPVGEPPRPSDRGDRRVILSRLLELIRPEFEPRTWEAFWRVASEGRSAKDVAEELGMKVGAVYTAKSKVLKRLREEAEALRLDRAEDDVPTADVAVAAQHEVTS